jgi:hypothetical protein
MSDSVIHKEMPLMTELDPMGPSFFGIRGCRIRHNLDKDGAILHVDPVDSDDPPGGGGMTIRGFTQENAGVLGCHFLLDRTLPHGHIVIEPLGHLEFAKENDE